MPWSVPERPRRVRASAGGRRGDHPARRRRLLLRVGRAAGRPVAPRASRHRGRRGRARGELRGEGLRHPNADGWQARPAALPPRGGRPPADGGLQRGEQGDVPGVRGHDAVRRGTLDRRGVPRRRWAVADLGHADRDRRSAPAGGAREGGPARHRRRGADEVPRQGRERRRQARRTARRPDRRGARVPASPSGRAPVGRRADHRHQAARAFDHDGGAGRGARRAGARPPPRPRLRSAPPRPRPQPGSPAGPGRTPPPIDRHAARARPKAEIGRDARHRPRRTRRPSRAQAAEGPSRVPNDHAPAAVRRLLARHPFAHAVRGDRAHPHDPRHRARAARSRPCR